MPDDRYHHGNLRSTLLEAAAASIERDGVEALSLRQLARDAGVSHAAPSRHFRDKQALLDALAEDGFRRLASALRDAASGDIGVTATAAAIGTGKVTGTATATGATTAPIASATQATPEQMRARFDALAHGYVAFALAQPTLLSLMFGLKHAPDARAELVTAGHVSMEITMRVVTDAQAIGAIAPGDPQRIALVAFATFHGIATLASGGLLDGVPADALVATAIDLFWRGLQP